LLFAALILIQPSSARAEDRPAATPYRPSVSTPATLSAPGWLEVELGLDRTRVGAGERSDALPYSLKLAFTPDWGIRIDGDAFLRSREAGSVTSGGGDTSLIVKRRLAIDDRSAFGLEAGISLPTAGKTLGSGSNDLLVNGIFSTELTSDWHVDLNLSATRFGDSTMGLSRIESGWAAAASRSLGDRWQVVGEFSGTRRRGEGSTSQFLVAASYASTKSVVWDVGIARGLTSDSPDWSAFAGVTFVALKLF
jgi:hypothetical protein